MAETLALIPVDRKERRGAAGCTEYILSDNIDAILRATEAIFLPDCAIDAPDITADILTSLLTDAVDSDRCKSVILSLGAGGMKHPFRLQYACGIIRVSPLSIPPKKSVC